MERITGPHSGFFIAARSTAVGSSWMGVAHIYSQRPSSFDDHGSVSKVSGDVCNATSELDAVENAERVARDLIRTNDRH